MVDIDYATTKVKEIIDGIVRRDEKTPRKWRKGLIVKLPIEKRKSERM